MVLVRRIAVLVASAFIGVHCACAQLAWDNKVLELHPSLSDTNVVAQFVFKNSGDYPVTITAIKPACDCTVSELQKKVYAPGERGEIVANYPIEEYAGTMEKFVSVQTDDRKAKFTRLTFRMQIPELFKASPRVLQWKLGEQAEPKTMNLRMVKEAGVQVAKVRPSDDKLKVQLETVKAGEEYNLAVTPADTSKASLVVIRIETAAAGQKSRTCYAYALIK